MFMHNGHNTVIIFGLQSTFGFVLIISFYIFIKLFV